MLMMIYNYLMKMTLHFFRLRSFTRIWKTVHSVKHPSSNGKNQLVDIFVIPQDCLFQKILFLLKIFLQYRNFYLSSPFTKSVFIKDIFTILSFLLHKIAFLPNQNRYFVQCNVFLLKIIIKYRKITPIDCVSKIHSV